MLYQHQKTAFWSLSLCILPWGGGLVYSEYTTLSTSHLLLIAWGIFSLWFLCWYKRIIGRHMILLLLYFVVGCLWGQWAWHNASKSAHAPAHWANQLRWFEGYIEGPITHFPTSSRAYLRLTRTTVKLSSRWQRAEGRILLKFSRISRAQRPTQDTTPPRWERGMYIRCMSKLRLLRWYGNPGLRDTRRVYKMKGVAYQLSVRDTRILTLQSAPTDWWRFFVHKRTQTLRWLQAHTPKRAGGLIRALVLGDRGGLAPSLRIPFAKTGTSHLLAISGLHLALLASALFFLFRGLLSLRNRWVITGRASKYAAYITLLCLISYTFVSGMSTSTVRACIMASMALMVWTHARQIGWQHTLTWAAFVILLTQPLALFSLSFQLSFLAVIALGWTTQPLEHLFLSHTGAPTLLRHIKRYLFGMVSASIIATLATLPFTLTFSPEVPLLAPIVNLVAIPLGGYGIVGAGLLAVSIAQLCPPLALPILRICVWSADGLCAWIEWWASLPVNWQLPPLRPVEWCIYYLCLLGLCCWRRSRKLSLLLLLAAVSLGGYHYISSMSKERVLSLHFVDIGQGDATLIRFPNGKTMMVDAGGEPFLSYDIGQHVLVPYFRWLRIKKLDYAMLSHPHPDHFGGFATLFAHYPPQEFWHNEQTSQHKDYKRMRAALTRAKTRLRTFPTPTTMWIGKVKLEILHPFPGAYEGKTYFWALHANDNSLVMLLTYGKIKILMTGDIEERGEELLTKRWSTHKIDLLKVPHHGSRTSSTERLLRHVRPRHAVASLGRANLFGFPHKSVAKRYKSHRIKLWRTDKYGLIHVKTDGTRLDIKTHVQQPE